MAISSWSRRLAPVLVAVALAGVAACGDDDEQEAPSQEEVQKQVDEAEGQAKETLDEAQKQVEQGLEEAGKQADQAQKEAREAFREGQGE